MRSNFLHKIFARLGCRRWKSGGFTMIELIVAMGIFVIIVSIASSGFISSLKTERRAMSLLSANSNMSLAIEQIAREIRTGSAFCIGENPCYSDSEIRFTNAQNKTVVYRFNSDNSSIERSVDGGEFRSITSPNVKIDYLKFVISGNEPGDRLAPRITIAVGVSPNLRSIQSIISNIQTTVSSRQEDS